MKKLLTGIVVLTFVSSLNLLAQKTCTSNPTTISANINFGSITWTASGGATVAECNNMADGLITFTGNVQVDLANSKTITISNNVNITGNFPISGGPGAKLQVAGGTLHVTGDLGDNTSNGVIYEVVSSSDRITVDGTLYGKNNNAFIGSGRITGVTLDVKNGSTCGTPCPVAGGFSNCTSGDSFCTTYGVTPVTLQYFEVSLNESERSVDLEWVTTMEENFDKFLIERSANGKNFVDIYEVAGQGFNLYDIESKYSFEDKAPLLGYNYYRLKALDLDGAFEYFSVKAVNVVGSKRIVIYPNPSAGEKIGFRTNFVSSESDRIIISDHLGHVLINTPAYNISNFIYLENPLKTGIYIVKYQSQSFESSERLIIKGN